MAVLVAYASRHGSTGQIAGRLAARLAEQGLLAQARSMTEVAELSGYDAVVAGSAIHGGDWLPEGASFLRRHRAALATRLVWLFSVSTIGEGSSAFPAPVARRLRTLMRMPPAVTAVAGEVTPRSYHCFAGVLQSGRWGLPGRVFLFTLGGRYGDHRNWQEIDGWAMSIASQFRAAQGRQA